MSKELKVGIITVIAFALLYYGFNFLRGNNVFSSTQRFYIKYNNVGGLNVSNPVKFNGLKVGKVSEFELIQEKGIIIVSVDVKNQVKLKENAKAILSSDGLLGGKCIVLDVGNKGNELQGGDTLISDIQEGLMSHLEPVADNMNTTVKNMNKVLAQLAETDIKGLVDTLKYTVASTTGNINRKVNQMELNKVINNTNNLVLSTKQKIDKLDQLITSSNSLVDSLSAIQFGVTMKKFNNTLANLEEMTSNMKQNKGTLGKLMNNDSIYNALNKLLVDLDELAVHFNQYPKDFLGPLGRRHRRQKGLESSKK